MSENEAKIFEKGAEEFQAAALFLAKTNLGFSLQKHRFRFLLLLPSTLKHNMTIFYHVRRLLHVTFQQTSAAELTREKQKRNFKVSRLIASESIRRGGGGCNNGRMR